MLFPGQQRRIVEFGLDLPQEIELEDTRETKKINVPSFCLVMRICFVTVCFLQKIDRLYLPGTKLLSD